jgi:anti-sigma-K factor RskA
MDPVTAGEYALGLLDEAGRREFEQAAARDPQLQRELRAWEARLAALGLALKPVAPSPLAWLRLQRAIGAARPPARPTQAWAALATAAALLLGFGWYREASRPAPPPMVLAQPAPTVYVALLQVPQSTMNWTVSVTPDKGELAVLAGGEPPAAAAALDAELWLITDEGPVSLGVIPKTGELHRALLSRLPVATGRTLAVSLEPRGGSPSGKPTGPVVTSSALLRAG